MNWLRRVGPLLLVWALPGAGYRPPSAADTSARLIMAVPTCSAALISRSTSAELASTM
jgi:hypothetical protein